MPDSLPTYELYAIRYATREGRRTENFVGGDPHDGPMRMDYFMWVAIGETRTFVIESAMAWEHADILAALRAGDGETAHSAMERHILFSQRRMAPIFEALE